MTAMKKHIKHISMALAGVGMMSGLWACSAEAPFDNDGEGTVYLRAVVNSITTRAEGDAAEDSYDYAANCVVYISRTDGDRKGLVYKEKGLANLKETITLRAGQYAAEAWSGDSLAASFTKKFYRGYETFEVTKGGVKNVVVNCKIQNVVVSVNTSNEELQKMIGDDFKVTVTNNSHSGGSLEFNMDNIATARGYFMMAEGDTDLQYTVSGTKKDGTPIPAVVRKIANVERAHHYILKFTYTPPAEDDFGSVDSSAITITVEDEKVEDSSEEDKSLLPTEPVISGVGFAGDAISFVGDAAIPEDVAVMICSVGEGLQSASLTVDDGAPIDLIEGPLPEGMEWKAPEYDASKKVSTAFILLKKDYILGLSKGTDHSIFISVTDANGKSGSKTLTLTR